MKYAKYALLDTDFISKLCVARKDDENCMMDRQSVKNQAVFFLAILRCLEYTNRQLFIIVNL